MANYYPTMLDVRGRSALVIGGNALAAEKASALHAAGARVTIMNPTFSAEVLDLARLDVVLRYKAYESGDLANFFVVIATTTYEPTLSQMIWEEAEANQQLINVVDDPAHCNFILPSILRRGPLAITVSTEGTNPALAKRIRQQIEHLFPTHYDIYLRLAGMVRTHLRANGLSYAKRDEFFGDFFASDILNLLGENDVGEALAITTRLMRSYGIDIPVTTIIEGMKEAEEGHGTENRAEHDIH